MTDRQRIIDFLIERPKWVDAYRLTHPDLWVELLWEGTRPFAAYSHFSNPGDKGDQSYVIPPEGDWRPMPEPEIVELIMSCKTISPSRICGIDDLGYMYFAPARFAGKRVRITTEAIS